MASHNPRSISPNDPQDRRLVETWIHGLKTGRLFVYKVDRHDDPMVQTTFYKFVIFESGRGFRLADPNDHAAIDLLIGVLSLLADIVRYAETPVSRSGRYELQLEMAVSYQASHALQIHQSYAASAQAIAQQAWTLSTKTNVSIAHLQKFLGYAESAGRELPVEHSTEVLVGYRDFDLDIENMMLKSRNGTYWEPREKLAALCSSDPFASHDAPSEKCACGIYAFDKPDNKYLDKERNIWGEIYLWGEVLVCENGFRAEFAYPKSIFVRDKGTKTVKRLAKQLEDDYGVPTLLMKERTGQTLGEIMEKMIQEITEAK